MLCFTIDSPNTNIYCFMYECVCACVCVYTLSVSFMRTATLYILFFLFPEYRKVPSKRMLNKRLSKAQINDIFQGVVLGVSG